MLKPGDLDQIRAGMPLWEKIGNNAGYRSICRANKDDFVIIVEYTQGSTYTKILHNEHGLKWVVTNNLDIRGLKMFKPNDLAILRWDDRLWAMPPFGVDFLEGKKNDVVIIVEVQSMSCLAQVLHPEHGLKWIATVCLNLLNRPEDV